MEEASNAMYLRRLIMTEETQGQSGETVRAIWNKDLTLKICWGEDIVQEDTQCECPNCRTDDDTDDDTDDEPLRCGAMAWPAHGGPIVVSGDGRAHVCVDCVYEIDPYFVDAYEDAFYYASEGRRPRQEDWMDALDALAAYFPPEIGIIIERGSPPVDR
jgi:hypothetical protein